jgi:hypothetical protein
MKSFFLSVYTFLQVIFKPAVGLFFLKEQLNLRTNNLTLKSTLQKLLMFLMQQVCKPTIASIKTLGYSKKKITVKTSKIKRGQDAANCDKFPFFAFGHKGFC